MTPDRNHVDVHCADARVVDQAPIPWALAQLTDAAREAFGTGADADLLRVLLVAADDHAMLRREGLDNPPGVAEAFTFAVQPQPDGVPRITVAANDARGYAYALTEVAEHLRHEGPSALERAQVQTDRPAVPVRGIQRSFSSAHEDTPWFHDRAFWTAYLDHLALQRFNRFQLALGMQYNYGTGTESRTATDNYLCFPYPFLLDVPGYEVRAQGVTDAERDRNLESLTHIAKETRRRGMAFQLGLWNHAYDFGYDSPHWYPILGISGQIHASYSAAALAKLLRLLPEIDGLTFRVHHEGGVHEEGHEHFWNEIFQAVSDVGRPIEVDMHAKGVDSALLKAVDKPNIRPVISAKYWAEHMGLPYHQASIRERELTPLTWAGMDRSVTGVTNGERRFTRYGYADYLSEDRTVDVMFRMWPGTQKLLLWGDPEIAAGFGRYATLGGSRGLEFCEPLYFKGRKGTGRPYGRDPYLRSNLRLDVHDWRKYRYTYLLWGRLLYNPDTHPDTWRRFLSSEYGVAAPHIERALSALSKILPLVTVVHGVSGANNFYWPEMYVDLAISYWKQATHYAFDTAEPRTWEGVSPFDPTMFYAVGEFVDDLLSGQVSGKYTPVEVAAWIDSFVADGERGITATAEAESQAPQTERTLVDLRVLAELGRFFAGKLRAAVDYAIFRRTADPTALERAVEVLGEAHAAYARIPSAVAGVYQDDMAFGVGVSERGHWSDRLMAMREDLHLLKLELSQARSAASASSTKARPVPAAAVVRSSTRARVETADRFERGSAFLVRLREAEGSVDRATLHYRRLNQGERFQTAEMRRCDGGFAASIPAEYTAGSFPLVLFVEAQAAGDPPVILPGFEPCLDNQPYIVVHSTSWKGA